MMLIVICLYVVSLAMHAVSLALAVRLLLRARSNRRELGRQNGNYTTEQPPVGTWNVTPERLSCLADAGRVVTPERAE